MRSLKDYQRSTVDFLLKFFEGNPAAGVFADMGLGKTAISLHVMESLPKPILLVGPIRVIEGVWRQEAKLWPNIGLVFSLVRGSPKERVAALATEADVYLINPELLADVLAKETHAASFRWKTLVIDESSLYKNPKTMRFKTLRRYLKYFQKRLILTGTPTPNGLQDLWTQIFILDLGQRLGAYYSHFQDEYFTQTDYQGFVFAPVKGAMEEVVGKVSDLVVRLAAKDVIPPRSLVHNQLKFKLDKKAREFYDLIENKAVAEIQDSAVTVATVVAALMKLRQTASGFVYDDEQKVQQVHTQKLDLLEEVIEETGSPVLVFYQFKHELAALRKRFPRGRMFASDQIEPWNRGEIPVMFLQPQSGGFGVNLQFGGHTIAVFSGTFSQEQMSQAYARIDRPGQEHPVFIHHLIAEDTVDELIYSVIQEKTHNQDSLLERIKEYATNHHRGSGRER